VRIPEPVDARLDGNRPGGRPVRRWIGHGLQVTSGGQERSDTGRFPVVRAPR
jgi:hypothetical protein